VNGAALSMTGSVLQAHQYVVALIARGLIAESRSERREGVEGHSLGAPATELYEALQRVSQTLNLIRSAEELERVRIQVLARGALGRLSNLARCIATSWLSEAHCETRPLDSALRRILLRFGPRGGGYTSSTDSMCEAGCLLASGRSPSAGRTWSIWALEAPVLGIRASHMPAKNNGMYA
jgi:hypothetical protein